MVIASILFFINGIIFLYANFLTPDDFCKYSGMALIATGLIIILITLSSFLEPIIIADREGVSFDISIFGKGIFIPSKGIIMIKNETFSPIRFRHFSPPKCLAFEIQNIYYKRLPLLLKNVYGKYHNKLYFSSGSLSIPVDTAVDKLRFILHKSS